MSKQAKTLVGNCIGEFNGNTESKEQFGKALQGIPENDTTYKAYGIIILIKIKF